MKLLFWVRTLLESVLCIVLFAMVALTFADVVGRRLLGTPIFGAHDITEHLMAIMIFCGLPLVTASARHLTVDLLDRWIMSPAMAWWHVLTALLVATVLGLIAWLFFHQASEAVAISERSQELNISRAPIYIFMGACSLLAAIASLVTALAASMAHWARGRVKQVP